MSADRQRLTSAIRRIAKTDPEIRGLLDAADNKGGKPGAAGVGGGSGEGEESRICCDGSVNENPNPGVDERNPDGGDQDGLDTNDPPNLGDLDGGCLTGVTNCDTGEAVCFCGDGFIPPDGWESPSDPPIKEGWTPDDGEFYVLSFNGCGAEIEGDTRTIGQAGDITSQSIAGKDFCETVYGDTLVYSVHTNAGSNCDSSTTNCRVQFDRVLCGGSTALELQPLYCGTDYKNPAPEEQLVDAWPSDGCVNLAVKKGTIVGSKYDPENDGSYSAPRSEIHLCGGTDDMYLKPSADGGWKSIDSTKTNGYLYNSKFEKIAHIDGNEYSDPTM